MHFPTLSLPLLLGLVVDMGSAQNQFGVLEPIEDLIEKAYPTWCIDDDEKRITDVDTCSDDTPNGRFSPLYFTKKYSGGDPALGGYPTNIDINYAFEFAAPFFGQACAGSPHHCTESFDGSTENCKKCPKIGTDNDNGPYGPGHVPPHIALAATVKAYEDGFGGDVSTWFHYNLNACRILPNVLYDLIRNYFPRGDDGKAYYPPPFSTAGGAYPLEFVNLAGASCEDEKTKHSSAGDLECFEQHSGDVSQYPDYLKVGHGSPHYCTKDGKDADVNDDWCPYIFFGPNRGKYRHPHIAFSAVEVFLANQAMPDNCGTNWDDSNYPAKVDTTAAFPDMKGFDAVDGLMVPEQPTIKDGKFVYPGPDGKKKKPAVGNFATNLVIVADTNNEGSGDSDNGDTSSATQFRVKVISVILPAIVIIFGV